MRFKGYRWFPPDRSHTLHRIQVHTDTYPHTWVSLLFYLSSSSFFLQAVPGTDGQFHRCVRKLFACVNQTSQQGLEKRKGDEGTEQRLEQKL